MDSKRFTHFSRIFCSFVYEIVIVQKSVSKLRNRIFKFFISMLDLEITIDDRDGFCGKIISVLTQLLISLNDTELGGENFTSNQNFTCQFEWNCALLNFEWYFGAVCVVPNVLQGWSKIRFARSPWLISWKHDINKCRYDYSRPCVFWSST